MLLRSVLFVPGNSMRMITKAATTEADALILDLEDAVASQDKPTARVISGSCLKALKAAGATTIVRVNALPTGLTSEDLRAVVNNNLDGVMLPKAEGKSDITQVEDSIAMEEERKGLEPGRIALVPIIESARGVVHAFDIASASTRVVALAFGAGDYCRDLGRNASFLSPEQNELLYARSQIVNSAVAAGVQALDTVYFGLLTDKESFTQEAHRGLQLGFRGKSLIHPSQIALVNETFAPTKDEVSYARGAVAAFEDAQAQGLGAVSFQGRMIDYMSYCQAKDLVDLADGISAKQEQKQQAGYVPLKTYFEGL